MGDSGDAGAYPGVPEVSAGGGGLVRETRRPPGFPLRKQAARSQSADVAQRAVSAQGALSVFDLLLEVDLVPEFRTVWNWTKLASEVLHDRRRGP
jgi:hypothetical protein